MIDETNRLEAVSEIYSSKKGLNQRLILYRLESMRTFFRGKRCLELGCADGQMTEHLIRYFDQVVAVDGSRSFIEDVQETIPGVQAHCSLIEEFEPAQRFETVLLCNVLEHVESPVNVLKKVNNWITPGACLVISVPNAASIHRHVGVILGMLENITDLNEADFSVGHRRVYALATLAQDLAKASLKVVHWEGIFFKPLSNAQIESSWSPELIDAFFALGRQFPELCAELLVIAEPDSEGILA